MRRSYLSGRARTKQLGCECSQPVVQSWRRNEVTKTMEAWEARAWQRRRSSIDLSNFATGRTRGSSFVVSKLGLPISANRRFHNLEEGARSLEDGSCT